MKTPVVDRKMTPPIELGTEWIHGNGRVSVARATAAGLDHQVEAAFARLHRCATGAIIDLTDGLYSNIEDGLFELAARDPLVHTPDRCFALMREMRSQRGRFVRQFANGMQGHLPRWFVSGAGATLRQQAEQQSGGTMDGWLVKLTAKSDAHFGGLLNIIAGRAAVATGLPPQNGPELPIAPAAISRTFVHTCHCLSLDQKAIDLLLPLLSRFVLDQLGRVYAATNVELGMFGSGTDCEESEDGEEAKKVRAVAGLGLVASERRHQSEPLPQFAAR